MPFSQRLTRELQELQFGPAACPALQKAFHNLNCMISRLPSSFKVYPDRYHLLSTFLCFGDAVEQHLKESDGRGCENMGQSQEILFAKFKWSLSH
eukprot:239539-Amphidinium_carterae.9